MNTELAALDDARSEDEFERLRRWAASLRRSSAATLAEAEKQGPAWEFYELSIDSGNAQARQAAAMEAQLERESGIPPR